MNLASKRAQEIASQKAQPRRGWLAAVLTLVLACLAPSIAYAQSCVAGSPIGSYPFRPGSQNPFNPGDSRTTQASFNGRAGDTLTFQAVPGGASSQIALLRSINAAVIATITVNTTANYTLTAADIALAPFDMRFTNNSTVNQSYIVNCTPAPVAAAPTVTAISPASGTTAGGTAVTITGTDFTGATAVSIGGVAAGGFSVVSATTITATTGAHAAGPVNVVVTTPGGTGTGVGLFTYVAPPPPPTVTAISPASGSTAGGTSVTITGTNFTGATAVSLGGVAASSFSVVNATTITATTGAHAAGLVNVAVTTAGGTGTGAGLYTYIAPLVLTSTPSPQTQIGQPYSQTNVASGGTPAYTFTLSAGVLPAGLTLNAATGLVFGTPTAQGPFSYTIRATDSGAPTQTTTQALSGVIAPLNAPVPTVTSINPSSGGTGGGTPVTITGTNFLGASAVTIGGVPATGVTIGAGATTITATTGPHAAGVVDVVVTAPGGSGTGAGLFTYVAPQVTPLVLTSTPSAQTKFGQPYSQTNVASGGTPAYAFAVSAGALPAGLTLNAATGVVSGTPTTAGPFSYTIRATDSGAPAQTATQTLSGIIAPQNAPVPSVAAISPNSGAAAGGTVITITGANFIGATAVTLGGVAASSVTVVNPTTITATTGAHAAGVVDVVVTAPGGTGTGTGLYTYLAPVPAPTVTAVAPASGGVAGGTVITILGANFTGATAITIGGVATGEFTVVDAGTITTTTGAHAAGVVDVVVTTPAGSGVGSELFTYTAPAPTPTRTIEVIAGFMGRRNTLLASNEPDANREIDRLVDAGQRTTSGFAGLRWPDPSAHAPLATGTVQDNWAQLGIAADARIGPPRLRDAEIRNFEFATSLRDLTRQRAAEAGFDLSARQGARANPLDVWLQGTYASLGDRRSGGDLDGHFGLLMLGADYVASPRLLLGGMIQFDSMSQHSNADASDMEGRGWMAGPYATVRLADNVFWRVRAAWGRSSNDVRPFLTYADQVDTERWLVSSRLTGNLTSGRWSIRPSASVFYMEDVAESYTDGAGVRIPEIKSRLGQIEAGPEVSYRYQLDDIQFEPHAGLHIATTFTSEANAAGFGDVNSSIVGADGVRTRAEFGVRAVSGNGLMLDFTGHYDGIGSDRYEAYGARVTLRVPLR